MRSKTPLLGMTWAITLALYLLSGDAAPVRADSGSIVISQLYGGGGNSGSSWKNDFVELFNRGTLPVDVTGWSVQYASAVGTTWQKTELSGVIQPGHYHLIQEAAGTGGTRYLPVADVTGSIAMSASNGKIALVDHNTLLTGSCPATVVDLVGFGSADCYRTKASPALSNTGAALRAVNGCSDTGNNSADFAVGVPAPRNSASPAFACGLNIVKTAPSMVGQGATFTYTLTVTNATVPPTALQSILITDVVPSGATYVSDSASDDGELIGATVSWPVVDTLPYGQSMTRTFQVVAPASPGTVMVNWAYAATASNWSQPGAGVPVTTTASAPNLYVAKSGPDVLLGGQVVTYTLLYGNTGYEPAAGVMITDALPAGFSAADIVSDASGLSYVDGADTRTWTLSTPLAAGKSYSFTLSMRVPLTVQEGAEVVNTVRIDTVTPGDDPDNNQASSTATAHQVLPIGVVQGAGSVSPYQGRTVVVRGVIYDQMLSNGPATKTRYGFFLQSRAGSEDGDAATSDGIYVYLSSLQTIGGYRPLIGDEIILEGMVSEYAGLTELANPLRAWTVVDQVSDMDAAVPATDVVQPTESQESMRVKLPAGAMVVAPTYLYASTSDTEFFAVHPESPAGQRSDAFTRRVYRDQYPGDSAYLISVEANVLKATAHDYGVQMPAANVYDRLATDLVGPLYYGFGKYTLMPETAPSLEPTLNANDNWPPKAPDRQKQFTIETANLENLYDYLDDPVSACDYNGGGNTGCPAAYPGGSSAYPPFDYPAASEAAYRLKIEALASQVITGTHAPDIITVEEAENQDICSGGGELYGVCQTTGTGNPDGKLDVLQDLAQEIRSRTQNAVTYEVASDRLGGDYRGIIAGFLYRADRVELLAPATLQSDPILGMRPGDPLEDNRETRNPKALQGAHSVDHTPLFDRRPEVALFRVHRLNLADGDAVELYVIGNHFKSSPDSYIQLRTEQAAFNAGLVAQILAVKPDARVAVLGDLNVYPDSPQLAALYVQMSNTYYDIPAAARYSYSYSGMSQTLDQIFVSGGLSSILVAREQLTSTRIGLKATPPISQSRPAPAITIRS